VTIEYGQLTITEPVQLFEEILDYDQPLAGPPAPTDGPHWALLNLILTIFTGVIMAFVLTLFLIGKRKEEEDDAEYDLDAERDDRKQRNVWSLSTIVPTLVAIIAFMLTEDMSLPMQLTDKWTVLMVAIAVVQIVAALLIGLRNKGKDQPEEAQQNV